MTDCLGRAISVGDVITYPVRYGSSMYIRTAVVRGLGVNWVDVEGFERHWLNGELHRYKTYISVTKRATITGLTEEALVTTFTKETTHDR